MPEQSPSWKLRVRGAEALTDGSAGDLNGNSGEDDSLHTMHTQVLPMLAARVKKHDVGVKLTLIRESVGASEFRGNDEKDATPQAGH